MRISALRVSRSMNMSVAATSAKRANNTATDEREPYDYHDWPLVTGSNPTAVHLVCAYEIVLVQFIRIQSSLNELLRRTLNWKRLFA